MKESAPPDPPPGGRPGRRIAPLTFSDLLVSPGPGLLSLADLLADPAPTKPSSLVTVRRPRPAATHTTLQAPLPRRITKIGPDKEAWYLRCFCNIDNELGAMILCEKCGNWQHQTCVRLNANTTPNNYVCPICAGTHIRCTCEENLNYRLPLIKCSKCGYWTHKRCEGLDPGPYFTDGHVCRQCGGRFSDPPDVTFPYHCRFPNPVVRTGPDRVAGLHSSITTAPFVSVLKVERDLSAFQFCEQVYNEFRHFVYLTHPQVTTAAPKKRRGDVCFSFFRAVFYVLEALYDIRQDMAVRMFDLLAKLDIYLSYELPSILLPSANTALEFSELARIEADKAKHIPDVPQAVLPRDLVVRGDGLYCQSPLQPEQAIAIVGGFVGLIDEFTFENGVDHPYYVISGTKYILDARRSPPQLVHNFRRSLSPNCVLKIVRCQGNFYVLAYAGVSDVNGIAKRTRREKFAIPANTELLLPIDFAPATIEEPLDFINWHFEEIEVMPVEPPSPPPQPAPPPPSPKHVRPSREERDELAVIRQVDRVKKSKRKPKDDRSAARMKRRPGKSPRSPKHVEVAENSLFSLLKAVNPEPYLFSLPAHDEDALDGGTEAAELLQETSPSAVDCSFLNELLCEDVTPFVPLQITDPIREMQEIVDFSGFD